MANISDSVHQVIQQVPTIQDIARGVEGFLDELNPITMNLRTDLAVVAEKVAQLDNANISARELVTPLNRGLDRLTVSQLICMIGTSNRP